MKEIKNIVLDLDQTLISGEEYSKFVKGHKNFSKQFYNRDKQVNLKSCEMDEDYIVYERPGLQKFLDWLFKNFNVSVWTAASKSYGLHIIENIVLQKDNRSLDFAFFSYHCDISQKHTDNTKDLSMLWNRFDFNGYNENNTIIIDDYDEVYKTHPNNCIPIKKFNFIDNDCESDNELNIIREKLEKICEWGIKNDGDCKKKPGPKSYNQ